MIHLYSGTPGSGKSFHATEKIFYRITNEEKCNMQLSYFVRELQLFGIRFLVEKNLSKIQAT